MRRAWLGVGIAVAAVLVHIATVGPGTAPAEKDKASSRVVMFASDGMRPDLMESTPRPASCRPTSG